MPKPSAPSVFAMVCGAFILLIGITVARATPPQGSQDNSRPNPKSKVTKEELRRHKAIRTSMTNPYWGWLHTEVPYIITDQEIYAFKRLSTDDDREAFIENFWERRNPNPGSPENEYKEEYYRQMVYANEQFGSGIPGWKTDRGRIYIMYGPPDEIDSHPGGGSYGPPDSESGGKSVTYPFERWRYRCIEGIGENINLKFVDSAMDGEFHPANDPVEKDALLHVVIPEMSASGQSAGCSSRPISTRGPDESTARQDKLTRLDLYARSVQPPAVKFTDLKAAITAKQSASLLPFDVRTDFIRATDETTLTPITIQVANSDVQFQNKDGVMHGALHIYGTITNLGGHVVSIIEKSLVWDVPEGEFQEYKIHKSVYQQAIPLRPGRYKLSLVLKDDLSGHMGTQFLSLVVPNLADPMLGHSSVILADQLQALPAPKVASGPFVIGGWRVHASVNNTFTRDQKLGVYMQVYNLGIDDQTHKPALEVRYEIQKDGKAVYDQFATADNLKKASQQFTAATMLPLQSLTPGTYTVQIKVTDNIKKQSVSPSAAFEVR